MCVGERRTVVGEADAVGAERDGADEVGEVSAVVGAGDGDAGAGDDHRRASGSDELRLRGHAGGGCVGEFHARLDGAVFDP